MFHFFGHQFLVYLACESVAPLGVQTAHILVFQNPESKNVLCRNATFACFVPAPLHQSHICLYGAQLILTVFFSVNQSPNGLYSTVILVHQDFLHMHAAAVYELMTLSTIELTFHEAQPPQLLVNVVTKKSSLVQNVFCELFMTSSSIELTFH